MNKDEEIINSHDGLKVHKRIFTFGGHEVVVKPTVISAMEKQSIGFAEWLGHNYVKLLNDGYWAHGDNRTAHATKELYDLYNNQP